ncbi:MAG: cobalt/nickel transport system permease protein [Actinomycetota bacterium]|nr:cobalt/nickel transport system permease protein [Actinomycetota bacterium]
MEGLYLPGETRIHRLPAQVKVVAAVLFALVVVATPREDVAAFGGYAVLVGMLVAVAGIPPALQLRRMALELPFVIFAILLPVVGRGERIDVGPLTLSEEGLWAAWNILAKGTLGVAVAVVLAATTRPTDLVGGLARLRLPGLLVQITGFMVRYVDVVAAEAGRMRTAMVARGFRAHHVRAWPAVARSLGALFIRTYERGERIQVAMMSRGYDGTARAWAMGSVAAPPTTWVTGLALPAAALTIGVLTWLR